MQIFKLLKRQTFIIIIVSFTFAVTSCKNENPLFLNNDIDLQKVQKKIEKLVASNQVDSVSIRSTNRKSLVSSIFILQTNEKDNSEYKMATEFLPFQKLELTEVTKIKKDALHSYKFNISTLYENIEKAKDNLPKGYEYKDVNGIRYAANLFVEKYYISLEVKAKGDVIPNEYVDVFYSQTQSSSHLVESALPANFSDVYYIVTFILQNDQLDMLKIKE